MKVDIGILDEEHLSDLFFNHEHPHMDVLYSNLKDEVSIEARDAALEKDAKSFLDCLPSFSEPERTVLIEWLVEDFNKRV